MIEEDPLVAFLYLLATSGFPMHSLEGLVSKAAEGVVVCKNATLHGWAQQVADTLTPEPENDGLGDIDLSDHDPEDEGPDAD